MIDGCDKFALVLQRLYSRALAIYPAVFRHEYAAEMTDFFGIGRSQSGSRRQITRPQPARIPFRWPASAAPKANERVQRLTCKLG